MTTEEKNKGGRPTTYTDDLAEKICSRIAEGESVRSVSKDNDMPALSTIMKWKHDFPEFSEQYNEAKQSQVEHLFNELLEIADTGEDVARDRLRVDTRKWFLSKVAPKIYGDKIDMTTDGEKLTPLLVKIIGKHDEGESHGDTN